MHVFDPELEQYATETQWKYYKAYAGHGNYRAAAAALGVHHSTVSKSVEALKAKAALSGHAPDSDLNHPVPNGFALKGVSDMRVNSEGKPQWVKYDAVREAQEIAFRAAIEAACADIPRVNAVPAPANTLSALCNLYTITDYHMGMLSWPKETGHSWDVSIATRTLLACFSQMVAGAPDSKSCVIAQLGDFLHFDGMASITPQSGHQLDTDTRFSNIVDASVRSLRAVTDMALNKHESVHIIMAEGNHDMASSIWLRKMFAALYEDEPRVSVDDSELPYYAYQHGKTMLAFHHGHLKKMPALSGYFAAQFPKMWGESTKRYGHTGHYHHTRVRETHEDSGIEIRQHPTLSARDAYAARGGWFAERAAKCFTYHKEYGEVGSNTVTPEMVE